MTRASTYPNTKACPLGTRNKTQSKYTIEANLKLRMKLC
jgi:hypothetical protein